MIEVLDAANGASGEPAALLRVKAVPGARRESIAGALGERLKVRVAAPPEGGKANRAICALVARALGVKRRSVTVHAGAASPEKTLRIEGLDAEAVRDALGRPPEDPDA